MKKIPITFEFDERSVVTLRELHERGFELTGVVVRDPESGESKTVVIAQEKPNRLRPGDVVRCKQTL